EPLMEIFQRLQEVGLLRGRKSDRSRTPPPRRRRPVKRTALRLGDLPPGIAIGGMQPAAAEVDRKRRAFAVRPGPPAQSRPRLDQKTVDISVREPPAGRDPGRPAADNH